MNFQVFRNTGATATEVEATAVDLPPLLGFPAGLLQGTYTCVQIHRIPHQRSSQLPPNHSHKVGTAYAWAVHCSVNADNKSVAVNGMVGLLAI